MKRRICALALSILVIALFMPAAALAEGSGLLTIDNRNVYTGMGKSYEAGYVPTQSGSKVRVVLPLLNSGAIQGDTITVTPNLGTPGSSPFVFGNYIKTVKLSTQSVNKGAATVPAFLVDLSLPLASGRMRGSYPVSLAVDYKDGTGSSMQQTFTLYVTVNGKDPNATPPAPTPEPVRHQPKVIVSKYAVDPDPVVAGGEFTLKFSLQNTSTVFAVSNIKVMFKSDAGLIPANRANTLYYNTLDKGKSMDVSVPMKATESVSAGQHTVSVAIDYEDNKATGFSAGEEIPIMVTQPLRLEFDTPSVPGEMTAGDTAPFALQVINKGRSPAYNVTCVLEAPGLLPQASSFLGNMEPGTAASARIMVFAGTHNMTSEDDDKSGDQFGKTAGAITVTYEDEFGKQYSAKIDIRTTVNAPEVPPTPEEPEPQPKAGQWWVSALVAAGLILAVVAALLVTNRNRMRVVQPREE